jgi:hypothetical protein
VDKVWLFGSVVSLIKLGLDKDIRDCDLFDYIVCFLWPLKVVIYVFTRTKRDGQD